MQEVAIQNTSARQEFFSASQVAIGTFLGGPVAAGFMFAHNFQQLRSYIAAFVSIGIGVGIGIWVSWNSIFLHRDELIVLVPIGFLSLAIFSLTAAVISLLTVDGAEHHTPPELSWKWTVLVGLASLIVQVGFILSVWFRFMWLFINSPD